MKLLEGKILLEEIDEHRIEITYKDSNDVENKWYDTYEECVSDFDKFVETAKKDGSIIKVVRYTNDDTKEVYPEEIQEEVKVEDGEDLPDAVPSEPIVVSSEPPVETEEETPKEEEKVLESNAIASILNSLIVDEFEAVEGYNSAISTLTAEDVEKYGDAIVILNDILDEENIHIGQLQEILKTISESASNIEDGEKEAQEVLNDTPSEEEAEAVTEGELNTTLSRKMGKILMPKPTKKAPRYCYEVYWYDNENWEGDPVFKKFWTKKAQQQWYKEHKNDPDKFGMWDLDGYNINECINVKGEE